MGNGIDPSPLASPPEDAISTTAPSVRSRNTATTAHSQRTLISKLSQHSDPLERVPNHSLRLFSVQNFCKGLRHSKLAGDVGIKSVTRYGVGVHRFLILQIQGGGHDFYIRLDRRPRPSPTGELTSNSGNAESRDTVRLKTVTCEHHSHAPLNRWRSRDG